MRNKVVLGVMLASGMFAFAQKDEVKDAEKAFKKANYAEALAAINSAESTIGSADAKLQAKYYYIKGQAYFNMAKNGENTFENMDAAAAAFDKLVAVEKESGKEKYTGEVAELKTQGASVLLDAANEKYQAKDYKEAYVGYEKVYRFSPVDTLMLYNAAVTALQAQDYDQSINYYEELKDLNYDGSSVDYQAIEAASGAQQSFGTDKKQRDLMVKSGAYTDPQDVKNPSKRSEVIKNLALLYVQEGQNDKALAAFAEAKQQNPEDVNLIISEANVYYQMGNKAKFKELMNDASKMAPDNADIQYNIGVVTMDQNDNVAARKAFERALEIKPDYAAAALNLSTSYINEGNALVEDMNSLGNSKADVEKFNKLKDEKDALFSNGAKALEEYIKVNGTTNKDVLNQLKNIYGALGDTDNFMRLKKLIEG